MNLKDRILSAEDRPKTKLHIPEWGVHVFIRTMSGTERDAWEQTIAKGPKERNLANFRARLAIATVEDEDGKLLFSLEDVTALGAKSCAALQRIFEVASKLNRLTDQDVEELTKNSDAPHSGDSISA